MTTKIFPFKPSKYIFSLIEMDMAFEEASENNQESIFFTEHEGIYSAGRSFLSSDFLAKPKLPVYFPNRGGKITVHSKGQLVVYPILSLKNRNLNVSDFVWMLEKWMIVVLEKFGIKAETSEKGRGVFVQGRKIGFVGINISKGISRHGLCLNISNDLSFFDAIVPCGLKNIKITSISRELSAAPTLEEAATVFKELCPF